MCVTLDKKGLSLVEVMIALVILLLVSLALMQTALISIESNMKNVLRDEGLAVAEDYMIRARNIPFDTLTSATLCRLNNGGAGWDYVPMRPRNVSAVNAIPCWVWCNIDTNLGVDNRRADIRVWWLWKNQWHNHNMSAMIRRPL